MRLNYLLRNDNEPSTSTTTNNRGVSATTSEKTQKLLLDQKQKLSDQIIQSAKLSSDSVQQLTQLNEHLQQKNGHVQQLQHQVNTLTADSTRRIDELTNEL